MHKHQVLVDNYTNNTQNAIASEPSSTLDRVSACGLFRGQDVLAKWSIGTIDCPRAIRYVAAMDLATVAPWSFVTLFYPSLDANFVNFAKVYCFMTRAIFEESVTSGWVDSACLSLLHEACVVNLARLEQAPLPF